MSRGQRAGSCVQSHKSLPRLNIQRMIIHGLFIDVIFYFQRLWNPLEECIWLWEWQRKCNGQEKQHTYVYWLSLIYTAECVWTLLYLSPNQHMCAVWFEEAITTHRRTDDLCLLPFLSWSPDYLIWRDGSRSHWTWAKHAWIGQKRKFIQMLLWPTSFSIVVAQKDNLHSVLSCQPRVTVASCFVDKVIRDLG